MIQEIKQDIFLAPADVIVHQANCFCTMGSGIARTIREKFPEVYQADCETKKGDRNKLGTFSYSIVHSPENPMLKAIFNLYGQFDMGLDRRYTDYNALTDGFWQVKTRLQVRNQLGSLDPIMVLAVPYKMGSDRGGGDWRIVRAIMESVFANDDKFTLLICELPK